MASSSCLPAAATSPIDNSAGGEPRSEAAPLPRKRGELGYREDIHGQSEPACPQPEVSLPARHPADRDAAAASSDTTLPPPPADSLSSSPAAASDTSSTNSASKRKRLMGFLRRPTKGSQIWGINVTTFLAFFLQLSLAGATIAAWAICIRYVMHPPQGANNNNSMPSTSSSIFIHIVFGIALLAQLLFLERRVFLMRAQRYAFVHTGQILPSARRAPVDHTIAFSPWNRPPLPTYAAALAQNGAGTGDVEDHIIAQPPPPAYGNTRGSRLLLTGFLNETQRAQRPVSTSSQQRSGPEGDRPVSYMSHDDEWEIIQDADRALQLEQTLAQLERPSTRT